MDIKLAMALTALVAGTLAAGSVAAETYRLVHAIGNEEHVSAKGLSKSECEARKNELKAVATAVGTYNEQTGRGSITCLPESLFND